MYGSIHKVLATIMLISCSVITLAGTGQSVKTVVHLVNNEGVGKSIGTITFEDSQYGLLIRPQLSDLTPGAHGFHIHQNPSCQPGEKNGKQAAAVKAGGHYDPENTGKHLGPYDKNGHKGDLPVLAVNPQGQAKLQEVAPELTVSDIKGYAVVIHQHGDNYSDEPKPLGGGGARVACGVIK